MTPVQGVKKVVLKFFLTCWTESQLASLGSQTGLRGKHHILTGRASSGELWEVAEPPLQRKSMASFSCRPRLPRPYCSVCSVLGLQKTSLALHLLWQRARNSLPATTRVCSGHVEARSSWLGKTQGTVNIFRLGPYFAFFMITAFLLSMPFKKACSEGESTGTSMIDLGKIPQVNLRTRCSLDLFFL